MTPAARSWRKGQVIGLCPGGMTPAGADLISSGTTQMRNICGRGIARPRKARCCTCFHPETPGQPSPSTPHVASGSPLTMSTPLCNRTSCSTPRMRLQSRLTIARHAGSARSVTAFSGERLRRNRVGWGRALPPSVVPSPPHGSRLMRVVGRPVNPPGSTDDRSRGDPSQLLAAVRRCETTAGQRGNSARFVTLVTNSRQ